MTWLNSMRDGYVYILRMYICRLEKSWARIDQESRWSATGGIRRIAGKRAYHMTFSLLFPPPSKERMKPRMSFDRAHAPEIPPLIYHLLSSLIIAKLATGMLNNFSAQCTIGRHDSDGKFRSDIGWFSEVYTQ